MAAPSQRPPGPVAVLAIYFMLPAVLGLVAMPRTPSDAGTIWTGVVIWVTHFLLLWIFCFAALFLVSRVRNPLVSGRPQVYLLAALLGLLVARPVFWVRYHLQSVYLLAIGNTPQDVGLPFTFFDFSPSFFSMIARIYVPSLIAWIFFTAIADRYFGLLDGFSRTGALLPDAGEGEGAEDGPGDMPGQSVAAGKASGASPVWMKAEGHYTLMASATRQELVYCRFRDAVDQLAESGTQVHRSFWICFDSLSQGSTRLADNMIELADGTRIPVGPSYVAKVKDTLARLQKSSPPRPGPASPNEVAAA